MLVPGKQIISRASWLDVEISKQHAWFFPGLHHVGESASQCQEVDVLRLSLLTGPEQAWHVVYAYTESTRIATDWPEASQNSYVLPSDGQAPLSILPRIQHFHVFPAWRIPRL